MSLECEYCQSRDLSIFSVLKADQTLKLCQNKTTNFCKKGQTLFFEGQSAMGAYCLARGKVKLIKQGENGKEVLLRVAKEGAVLGLRGVLTGKEFVATCETLEDSSVCFIERQYFLSLIEKSPEFALKALNRLSENLSQAEIRISDMTNKDVRQRLAQLILNLNAVYGFDQKGERLIDITLTRSDLGSMIGASPETVMRILSDFKQDGMIELRGKKIIIQKHTELLDEVCQLDH